MVEFTQAESSLIERKPSVAAVLSMLYIGLGHVYCGRLVMGLTLNLLSLLPVLFAIAASLSPNPTIALVGLAIACVFAPAVYLFAVVDSYRLAKIIGTSYKRKDYNCGAVYALLIAGGIAGGITIAPLIAVNTRANVAEAIYCAGESMRPTLLKGDLFLINKRSQRQLPRRGDVVVFLCPEKRDTRYVKRVIGLPGDTIEVRNTGEVYRNGCKLEYRPVPPPESTSVASDTDRVTVEINGEAAYRVELASEADANAAAKSTETVATKVPQDHCFVLGDNRSLAEDSRRFGCVPLGDVLGAAELIYYPAKSWSRFGTVGD